MANLRRIESSCLSWSGVGMDWDRLRMELWSVFWLGGERRRGRSCREPAEMCRTAKMDAGGVECAGRFREQQSAMEYKQNCTRRYIHRRIY
jgi:hypothetical protein